MNEKFDGKRRNIVLSAEKIKKELAGVKRMTKGG